MCKIFPSEYWAVHGVQTIPIGWNIIRQYILAIRWHIQAHHEFEQPDLFMPQLLIKELWSLQLARVATNEYCLNVFLLLYEKFLKFLFMKLPSVLNVMSLQSFYSFYVFVQELEGEIQANKQVFLGIANFRLNIPINANIKERILTNRN